MSKTRGVDANGNVFYTVRNGERTVGRIDGRAFWLGPLDIEADPTGTTSPPLVIIRPAPSLRLSPGQARRAGALLIAAADFCEGGA